MTGDEGRPIAPGCFAAANDNGTAEARVEAVVLTLARLVGRQIARETFENLGGANDNAAVGKTDER